MRHSVLVFITSLFISSCALLESKPPPTIHPTRVTPAPSKSKLIDDVKNPFQSKAEEALFWKVLSGEFSNEEVPKIKDLPIFKIAIQMRMLLSCQFTDPQLRSGAIRALTDGLAHSLMNSESREAVANDLSGEEMINRWKAMHFIFEKQSKGTAIIYYALNDKEHLFEFFKKENAKCEVLKKDSPENKIFKPAPPATSSPPSKLKAPKPKSNKHPEIAPPAPAPNSHSESRTTEPRSCPTQSF